MPWITFYSLVCSQRFYQHKYAKQLLGIMSQWQKSNLVSNSMFIINPGTSVLSISKTICYRVSNASKNQFWIENLLRIDHLSNNEMAKFIQDKENQKKLLNFVNSIRECCACGQYATKLKKCKRCWKIKKDRVYYCNRHCQKRDWVKHKARCG